MAKSIVNQVSPSQVSGRLAYWHRVMEQAGLTYDDLQTPIDDPLLRKRLVHFWQSSGSEVTLSPKRARKIMGENFFGVEEAVNHFGVDPKLYQLAALSETPFSEAILEASKDTHILVAVFPLSILEIRHRVDPSIESSVKVEAHTNLFCLHVHIHKEPFVRERGETSWQLIRKTEIPNSTDKMWKTQLQLLGEDEEVPSARVLTYAIIGHYLASGERLFPEVYVRTSSLFVNGDRVGIGQFRHALYINNTNRSKSSNEWVVSAKKL